MIHLMIAMTAAATVPAPLAASGKWVVDYPPDMCVVSRPFGPADAYVMFAIKPAIEMTEGGATLVVLAPNEGGSSFRRGEAVLTLQPSGKQLKLRYASWIPKNSTLRGYEFEAGKEAMAALADTSSIALSAGKDSFALATGKVQPVLNALAACNDNLFRTWGVDPAAKAVMVTGADPASWFPQDSYPSEAMRRGAEGRSVVVLSVGSDGRPTACRATVKADPDLDQTTCRLAMKSARFETSPGKADRYSILSVHWVLGY